MSKSYRANGPKCLQMGETVWVQFVNDWVPNKPQGWAILYHTLYNPEPRELYFDCRRFDSETAAQAELDIIAQRQHWTKIEEQP